MTTKRCKSCGGYKNPFSTEEDECPINTFKRHDWYDEQQPEAARAPVDYRYDVLDSDFLHCMAQIGALGAEKYGDFNWQKSRLTGDKGPFNHIFMHLHQYKLGILHDKFGTRKHQLAAVAFNAMMEAWYLENMDARQEQVSRTEGPVQPPFSGTSSNP